MRRRGRKVVQAQASRESPLVRLSIGGKMPVVTRRDFLGGSLCAGAVIAAQPLLHSSGCGPVAPHTYFPPTGLERAFDGPAGQLRAASLAPGRIDLVFRSGGELRHKWFDVTSHRWEPSETGISLGAFEYPEVVVVQGKLCLFALSRGSPYAMNFCAFDLTDGWSAWIDVPGHSVLTGIAAIKSNAGPHPQVVALDSSHKPIAATVAGASGEWSPQPWTALGEGRNEWIDGVGKANSSNWAFGRMNTGALIFQSVGTPWVTVPDAGLGVGDGATSYYFGGTALAPVFFTFANDAMTMQRELRFLWTNNNGDQQFVNVNLDGLNGMSPVSPPMLISRDPTGTSDTERLDLFMIARSAATDTSRTRVMWVRATLNDIIARTLHWAEVAGDLSLGSENLAAVSSGPRRVDLFVTDVDGQVWHKWHDDISRVWIPS
jgi:hypothetical protein